jgi:PKD repeat protein
VGLNLTFGDGSYEVGGDQATHVHTAAGSYTASLNVTDLQGRSARATTTVTVNYDLTDLVIHAGPSAPSVGKNVSLSSSICGGTAPFSSG